MEEERAVYIQVRFKRNKDGYKYSDALYFTEEEYDNLSNQEIKDLEDAKFEAWKFAVQNPPAPVPMTTQEKQDRILELALIIAAFETEKLELENSL